MKKKMVSVLLASAMVLSLSACGKTEEAAEAPANEVEETAEAAEETTEAATEETTEAAAEETTEETTEAAGDVMSYADYAAADVDTEVTVETYVQAKQG
ncbi:MAG: hypothetical protein IKS16_08760, partial [Lachnospiraceae bacterium]|nr:hypothetical protein [Lachnospiraceae bacterium]